MRTQTFVGKLVDYEQLNASFYGNPRYEVIFENEKGELLKGKTASNSKAGFVLLNDRNCVKEVTYHQTRTGNIIIDNIRLSNNQNK